MEQNEKLKIRIAIVEDDEEDAKKLKEYISRAEVELNCSFDVFWFSHPTPLIDKYKANYDLIFLDIELPEMNGLELAHKIRERDSDVILVFVTNMAQFALEGYKVDAMDFVVKPVFYSDLKLKLERVCSKLQYSGSKKIVISDKFMTNVLNINEIKYIEVINHKLIFHTNHGLITTFSSLSKYENELKDSAFSRCNNCYLVNLKYVTKVENFSLYMDDEVISISRSKKKQFLKDLADYLGGTL